MIYLSYGMPKSASSYCYQLTDAMLRAAGHYREMCCKNYLPEKYHKVFLDLNRDEISEIVELVPETEILVIKTHTCLTPVLDNLLRTGKVKASATFRDPRDAAISVLEAGENDRKLKKFRKFNEIHTLNDAFLFYKDIKHCITQWLLHPDVLKISYNLLAFNPLETALKLRDHLQINVDVEAIVKTFSSNLKEKIWEFNVGKSGRYKEYMTDSQKQQFFLEFSDLINLMNTLDNRYPI